MKAVMLMFDSLNRHMLSPYGCDWTHTPNFRRLAERTATFNRCYGGSMPCMPARRELHTGRCNFLHTGWGPIEAYDDSMPQMLSEAGVYTHLVSDHYHYWEDGGSTYHGRYDSWEFVRGQEGDPFVGQVEDPVIPPNINGKGRREDWVNRMHMQAERDQPLPQTINRGIDFLRRNHEQDNWFLQLECFDPHEPFFQHRRYRDIFPDVDFSGELHDWPQYGPVDETDEEIRQARYRYAASVAMCDAYLGDVLDVMDELDLWEDTMLIVNTDHGHFLAERGYWAKNYMPWYDELIHIPMFVWDPRCPEAAGERRESLVQTIDLPVTLLDYFGVEPTERMQGRSIAPVIREDQAVRPWGLFGNFGSQVSVTDGRYVYMRGPAEEDNAPLFRYTSLPIAMRNLGSVQQLARAELAELPFSRGAKVYRLPVNAGRGKENGGTLLFDLDRDPGQERPLDDADAEQRMIDVLVTAMRESDAPEEQYERLGLPAPA